MNEKRKTKRFQEKNKAVISFSIKEVSKRKNSKSAWTQNLSIDGAKLLTNKSLSFDTNLIISLELPKSKQTVKLRARVVWGHSLKKKGLHEIGVKFIHTQETLPVFFKHLYGHGVRPKNKDLSQENHSFPVDVAEV